MFFRNQRQGTRRAPRPVGLTYARGLAAALERNGKPRANVGQRPKAPRMGQHTGVLRAYRKDAHGC